jgi:hypothetical protein
MAAADFILTTGDGIPGGSAYTVNRKRAPRANATRHAFSFNGTDNDFWPLRHRE